MSEKNEIKEVTMEELKSIMADGIKEIIPDLKKEVLDEVKGTLKDEVKVNSDEENLEKSANFIKEVCSEQKSAEFEKKAIDSDTESFGYAVPTELSSFILQAKDKIAKMRKLAFVFQMSGNFQLPTEGTGVTGYWVDENETITESNPTLNKKTLGDYYLAARVLIPRKLLNTSAYNIVNYVGELCARSLRNKEESAFVAGDGDAKPTGLRSASLTGTIAQAGSALEYKDMVKLYFALDEQYRDNAVFLTSSLGMQAILNVEDDNGRPIFDFNTTKVLGKPLVESADIPANLGSSADTTEIYFGDMWYYWIKDGEKMFVDTDKVLSKLQVELVVAEAVDGVYTLPAACKKMTGVK
ncbi:MAG: phage major capsid protein [Bacteroidia bacterium]|nr:phage major capsid protein [Bacteroidia bacterium]